MKIGIDIDDVLVNNDVIENMLSRHGYGMDVVTEFRIENLNIATHVKQTILKAFSDPTVMGNLKPNVGAVEFVDHFGTDHEIYAITARKYEEIGEATLDMMSRYFPKIANTYFVGGGKKSEIVNQLGLDIHIDDAPYVMVDLLANSPKTIKFLITNDLTPHNHKSVEGFRNTPVEIYNSLLEVHDLLYFRENLRKGLQCER